MKMTPHATAGYTGAQTQADEIVEESVKRGVNPQTLGVNLSKVIGLSEWFSGEPPEIGWWNARVKGSQDEDLCRRWWNGTEWSWAVEVGTEDSDSYVAEMQCRRTAVQTKLIEWQGLAAPWTSCRHTS